MSIRDLKLQIILTWNFWLLEYIQNYVLVVKPWSPENVNAFISNDRSLHPLWNCYELLSIHEQWWKTNMSVQNSICRWASWCQAETLKHTHTHTHIPQYKSLDWNECSNAMSLEATQGVILVWGGGKQAAECLSAGGRKRSSLCTSKALAWKVNSRASVLNM